MFNAGSATSVKGFQLFPSRDYRSPMGITLSSGGAQQEIRLSKEPMALKTELSIALADCLSDPGALLIGENAKDLYSLMIHLDMDPKCVLLDPHVVKVMTQSLWEENFQPIITAHDSFRLKNKLSHWLNKSRFQKIFSHLIWGLYPATAHMENISIPFGGKMISPRYKLGYAVSGRFSTVDGGGGFNPHTVKKSDYERSKYEAPDGYHFIITDQAAMELRVLAHLSKDPLLVEIFQKDLDFHDVILEAINKRSRKKYESRDVAKSVVFLIIFGGTNIGLAETLHIKPKEAQGLIDSFLEAFPGVHEWMLKTQIFSLENSYIESSFGRIKSLSRVQNLESQVRSLQNFCVQSFSADLNSLVLRAIDHMLPHGSSPFLYLHDGGVFLVKDNDLDASQNIIEKCMSSPPGLKLFGIDFDIPLKPKILVNKKWVCL